jgi:steroid delta-isomerase-like uncharacterized protein
MRQPPGEEAASKDRLASLVLGMAREALAGDYDGERGRTMNLQWAKGWLREFTPEGIAKTMSMYADQVDFEDVTLEHKESTAAGIQKFFTGFSRGPSQHRFEVTHWAGDDNGGAMEWTWHSKHETEIFGVPAKGKETTVRGISYIGLRNGKIVAERDYWDCATLLRQLGALK